MRIFLIFIVALSLQIFRSPENLVQFYLGFCDRQESTSIFSYTHYLFDSDDIDYETSP